MIYIHIWVIHILIKETNIIMGFTGGSDSRVHLQCSRPGGREGPLDEGMAIHSSILA